MKPEPRTTAPRTLQREEATRLLEVALSGARAPHGGLVERIEAQGGAQWFLGALSELPLDAPRTAEDLLHGHLPIEEMRTLKERCKRERARSRGDRELAALLGYYLSQAAALISHGKGIGSAPQEELCEALLELASVAPAPWSDWLLGACG